MVLFKMVGSFPLYIYTISYSILYSTGHLFFGRTSVMTALPLAHCAAIGQKNRKYLSNCYAPPP